MKLQIERRDIREQMDNGGVIDPSRPFGHVAIFTAVVVDEEGEAVEDAIASCRWFRNGRAAVRDDGLGECPPWEFRVDVLKGTEHPGLVDDLYKAEVDLTDGI